MVFPEVLVDRPDGRDQVQEEAHRIVVPLVQRDPGTGSSLRWLQSASKVVLPKPAGAETTVKSRLAPSSSRSCRRERGTAFAR